jgi:hypothetical protein
MRPTKYVNAMLFLFLADNNKKRGNHCGGGRAQESQIVLLVETYVKRVLSAVDTRPTKQVVYRQHNNHGTQNNNKKQQQCPPALSHHMIPHYGCHHHHQVLKQEQAA